MGKIAVMEDVEGIRDEEDVGDAEQSKHEQDPKTMDLIDRTGSPSPESGSQKGKYVASLADVQEAFDSINTLRYSQPTHLQGR